MPWSPPSETLMEFHRVAYRDGWVLPGFEWTAWMGTREASRLRDDPRAIERATAPELAA